jgi:hypothetical protein
MQHVSNLQQITNEFNNILSILPNLGIQKKYLHTNSLSGTQDRYGCISFPGIS